jgi:DNA polymerase
MLSNMLASLSFDPSSVYVTNLMKCRPPLDGSPAELQAQSCNTYLRRQIDLVKPELVILMGRDTAQQVLGSNQPMAALRQQVHQVDGYAAPMVVTYHPAYLLKQPRLKVQTWKDLQYAKRVMS